LFTGSVDPVKVTVFRINRNTNNFAVQFAQFSSLFTKSNDFSRTDATLNDSLQGPIPKLMQTVQWIKEQDQVLSLVIIKFDGFEFAIHDCLGLEVWSFSLNLNHFEKEFLMLCGSIIVRVQLEINAEK
jgi:hypothetical protein